jgi:DNA repair exonuclease SbcCD ATPase subunit
MRIVRLEIENILSIEHASIDFLESGLMLVDGWNYDTQSANGAGKSSIFNALSWGLFGEYPRSISVSAIVRNGARKSRVTVEVYTTAGQIIKVERRRPNESFFFKNGNEITEFEFSSALGITYDQFLLGQYFAQGLGQRFIDLNDSGRKDLILTLMKANAFTQAKASIDVKIKETEKLISALEVEISSADASISAYESSMHDEAYLLNREIELKESIRSHIDAAKKINKPDQSNFETLKATMSGLQTQLKDIASVKGSIDLLRSSFKDIERQKQPKLSNCDGECPKCGTALDYVDGSLIVHDSSSAVSKIEHWKKNNEQQKINIVSRIRDLEKKIANEQDLESEIADVYAKMADAGKDISLYEARQKEIKSAIDLMLKELEFLKKNIAKNADLRVKIENIKTLKKENLNKINTLTSGLDIAKAASQAMSPTGIPAYILDSVVESFNDRVQQYIQYVWPQASYTLNTFKENKSGSTSAKLSDSLTIDGAAYGIGSLSGGERKCLSIAIDFAILDVISQYTGAIMSPIILDEPFDHLDASNRARSISLLKELAKEKLIVVIDHASESKSLFDAVLTVSKKSGTSYVS